MFSGGGTVDGYLSVISENRDSLLEMLFTTLWHKTMWKCTVFYVKLSSSTQGICRILTTNDDHQFTNHTKLTGLQGK